MDTLTTTTVTTATTNSDAVAVMLGILGVGVIILYIFIIVAGWKIFKKAGEKGWKALIPIYDLYIFMKIVGMQNWFWLLLAFTIIVPVMQAVSGYTPSIADGVFSYDFAGHPWVSIMTTLGTLVEVIIGVYWAIRLSKAFGHGTGYAIGLVLIPGIMLLVLAFGSSKYDKKILKA